MAQMQMPTSERQRVLQELTFAENQILSRDLPRDTVLKQLQLRLSGAVQTTYASGTPVCDSQGTFDNIIPRIDVTISGSRVVKSVRPHLLHMSQLFSTLIQGERRSSAAATAALDNLPTADGGFVYGTTNQYTTVAETVIISFEHPYARIGRESTWLNLKGVASAELRLTCASFSKLLGFGNTAPVVYANSTFKVEILTIEDASVPAEVAFSDFKQTTKELTFGSETTEFAVDLNRGNKLSGIMLFAKDGAAGSATTATGKVASNLAITSLRVVINGQTIVKATNFKNLQAENRNRIGVDAKFASGVSRLDGVAYIDLLNRGDLSTALDVRPPLVDNIQLLVSTNNSTNVSYTNPVSLTVMTEEIVTPR